MNPSNDKTVKAVSVDQQIKNMEDAQEIEKVGEIVYELHKGLQPEIESGRGKIKFQNRPFSLAQVGLNPSSRQCTQI